MPERIPMSAPELNAEDYAAVMEVLRSGRLALGPRAQEFEEKMAEYLGVRYAVAVSSGTAGLHLLVRALGLGQGDEVLVPSFTFAASVNAILYEKATPVFVDVEPDTYTLDPEDLRRKITPRTRAIMVVDTFGHPAEWDEILDIARNHGLLLIDDACEALGAEYRGKKLGRFGDGAVFAFYPNKQMTTGEGGMVVTDNPVSPGWCAVSVTRGGEPCLPGFIMSIWVITTGWMRCRRPWEFRSYGDSKPSWKSASR